MSNYIKKFNTYYEQLNFLSTINEQSYPYPLLVLNKENNKINTRYDGTLNKKFKYDSDEYCDIQNNYYNKEFSIIPNDVTNLEIYDMNDVLLDTKYCNGLIIPKIYEEPLYKVGLMSDVHYNDTDETDINPDTHNDDGAEYSEDLINAITYFSEHVDFVSCAGDISTDSRSHLRNYKRCVNKYAPELSLFTCSGNHDTKPKFKDHQLWREVSAINPNNEYEVIYFEDDERYCFEESGNVDNYHTNDDHTGSSFYIKKYYDNTFDVYIYLNVEYGWPDFNSYDTHNCIKLTQEELLVHSEVDQENDLHLYHPQTLRCLADILEEYKDHRCFIFTHLMFPEGAGNFHMNSDSNNIPYYAYAYDYNTNTYNHADVLRGDQGEFIYNLMEQYDNNYWFCGHSHYKWIWEKEDHNINVTKIGNSYSIHLPSLSRPLPSGITGYKNAPKDSEGAIMEVYKNYVILKGLICKEGYNNSDINTLISEYSDENMNYVTPEMFTIVNNQSTIEQLEDDYIQINYKFDSSINSNKNNIYLNDNNIIDASNFGNYMPVLRFENVQIWKGDSYEYDSTNDITYEVLTERKIGFRDHTTNDDYYYYFSSNHIYTLNNYAIEYSNYNGVVGIVFKTSSDSKYKNENLHFRFKLKLGYVHIGYVNKFLPIACYKL